MKAVIQSAAKVGSRVRIGNHDLVFDQPMSVPGGEDRGPSPLDVLVVCVGACAHYYASAYLYGRHLPTADLSVEVESEKEQVPVPRLARLAIKVRVPPGISAEQMAQALPKPTMPGTLRVPLRIPRSWPPPSICAASRTRGLRRRT